MTSKQRLTPLVTAVLVLAGCGAGGTASPTNPSTAVGASGAAGNMTIVVTDGGGTYHDGMKEAIYDPCAAQTGINVVNATFDYSFGQIKAQVEGAKEWDVVTYPTYVTEDEAANYFTPIDYSVVSSDGIPDTAKHKYWVDYDLTGVALGYRTDKYSDPPTSWADLWDTANFPGDATLESATVNQNLEIALLADGVAPADIYPLDLDRAFDKLEELMEIRKVTFFGSGAEMVQLYTSGAVTIGLSMSGRFLNAAKEGAPLAFIKPGTILASTSWAVLKTAPQPEAAMEFIACAMTAERQAAAANLIRGQYPVNALAYDLLDPDLQTIVPAMDSPEVLVENQEYLAANFTDILARWQEWLAAR